MLIFGFLTIFFFIIPFVKMHYMPKNTNFRTKNDTFFMSAFQENEQEPNYDIRHWVQKLNLQQCVFVEIGEGFCALFVELKSIPQKIRDTPVAEFFLGICDCDTLRSWKLCSPELFDMRKSDCIFTEATASANTSARVHRRLCDITFLSLFAPICNCSIPLAGQNLFRTEGSRFPTCFLNPLPKSICSPRGICGVAGCTVKTIMGIHSPQCNPNCHQRQPFCEKLGPWTSVPPRITSLWSKWSIPKCNVTCGEGSVVSTAFCYNQVTGKKDIDCIGPGSFCCPHASEMCECRVTIENGTMKAKRFTKPCTSSDSCSVIIKQRISFPENQFEERANDEIEDIYEEFDQENLEEAYEYEEPISLSRRRLLGIYYDMDNYELMTKDDNDGEFDKHHNNERMAAIDDDNDDEDIEYDPDLENADDEVEEDEEEDEEGDEEEGEDDMMAFRKTRERKNNRKYNRVLRSDDEATFKRASGSLGFLYNRKKLRKKNRDCEDPSVTDPPIYREYENEEIHSSGVSIKSQISLLGLAQLIASFTIPFG